VRGTRRESLSGGGKGHRQEIDALLGAVRTGGPDPIPFRVLAEVTRATFAVHERLAGRAGAPV
jgi:hypothetical protein